MSATTAATVTTSTTNVTENDWKFPLLLSFLAGASTCIGAAIVFIWKPSTIQKTMTFSLSLAASVMITVSVISILPECLDGVIEFHANHGNTIGTIKNGRGDNVTTISKSYTIFDHMFHNIILYLFPRNKNNNRQGGGGENEEEPMIMVDIFLLVQRIVSFGMGCFSYSLLNKLLVTFPEPDVLLFGKNSHGCKEEDTIRPHQQQEDEEEGQLIGHFVDECETDDYLYDMERGRASNNNRRRISSTVSDDSETKNTSPSSTNATATTKSITPTKRTNASASTSSPTSHRTVLRSSLSNQQMRNRSATGTPDGKNSGTMTTIITASSSSSSTASIDDRPLLSKSHSTNSDESSGDVATSTTATLPMTTSLSSSPRGSEILHAPSSSSSPPSSSDANSAAASWRVAMLLFVSLLCHNFPEGLAVAASTFQSSDLGITVAIGIMIHNIPEGIAIAVPCIVARPNEPWLAFWLASISGLAEPLGAIVALTFLQHTTTSTGTGDSESSSHSSSSVSSLWQLSSWCSLENVLASVAGIMCMVAILELYPEAYRNLPSKRSINAITRSDNDDGQNNDDEHYDGNKKRKKHTGTKHTLLILFSIRQYFITYRPLITGTLTGMIIMILTEWYLP